MTACLTRAAQLSCADLTRVVFELCSTLVFHVDNACSCTLYRSGLADGCIKRIHVTWNSHLFSTYLRGSYLATIGKIGFCL